MRESVPSATDFRVQLLETVDAMRHAAAQHGDAVIAADRALPDGSLPRTRLIEVASPGLAAHRAFATYPAPKLILTSPPYPGVYVNYHRWKILGRKETAAPFWIADRLDGHGIAHYTMSARSNRTSMIPYFQRLEAAYEDIARVAAEGTWLVQVVGFNDPRRQLRAFLNVMEKCGFEEHFFDALSNGRDGRLWRAVPNRRWWVQDGTNGVHTSREVVLVHKRRRDS